MGWGLHSRKPCPQPLTHPLRAFLGVSPALLSHQPESTRVKSSRAGSGSLRLKMPWASEVDVRAFGGLQQLSSALTIKLMTTAPKDAHDQPLPSSLASLGSSALTQNKQVTLPCLYAEHASLVPTSGPLHSFFLLLQHSRASHSGLNSNPFSARPSLTTQLVLQHLARCCDITVLIFLLGRVYHFLTLPYIQAYKIVSLPSQHVSSETVTISLSSSLSYPQITCRPSYT